MARSRKKVINFTKGEINQKLSERVDLSVLNSSASYIKNYVATNFGGIKTRMGTKNIAKCGDGSKIRMIPFVFSEDEKYLLLLRNEKIDVFQSDTLIETIDAPELLEDYFDDLKYTQTEDVLILTHKNMITKRIARIRDTTSINVIPIFPSGATSYQDFFIEDGSNFSQTEAYKMVNQDLDTYAGGQNITNIAAQRLYKVEFDEARLISQLKIVSRYMANYVSNHPVYNYPPTFVKIQLKKAGVWADYSEDISSQFGTTTITMSAGGLDIFNSTSETQGKTTTTIELNDTIEGFRIFGFGSATEPAQTDLPINPQVFSMEAYDLKNTLFDFENFNFVNIPKALYGDKEIISITDSLKPSAEEGLIFLEYTYATSGIFNADDTGQYINNPDGSRARIVEVISSTKVSAYTIVPFVNTDSFDVWELERGYEEVWSSTRGYPKTCLFYQQRLWLGGSRDFKSNLWGSRVSQYNDFQNISSSGNDGIDVKIASREAQNIINLYDNRGLQIFTDSDEFVANEESLTPDNIFITKTTSAGSLGTCIPFAINGLTMFMEKHGTTMLSFVYTDSEASYKTSGLNLLSSHLIYNPIRMQHQINSDRDNSNFIFLVKGDGTMLTSTILADQNINAFTRFEMKEGKVLDVMTLVDDVYIIAEIEGNKFIQKLSYDFKVDNAMSKTSTNGVLNSLDDYEGLEVRVYNSSGDFGLHTITSGQILGLDDGEYTIGFDVECSLISNELNEGGRTTSIKKRITKATITTEDSSKFKFNGYDVEDSDNIFDVYGVGTWGKKIYFSIESVFDTLYIKSIELDINYGA